MISTPEHPDTTPPTPAPTPTHQPTPRLVATDLDGTIVRGDGTVSARTVSALMAVRASGADFVLVTGRPPRLMAAIAAAFGHQGLAICSNGAFRYDLAREKVIGQSPIQAAQLAEAAKIMRRTVPGIGLAVEYADGVSADALYEPWTWDQGVTVKRLPDDELFAVPAPKLIGRHPTLSADEMLAMAGPALSRIVTPYHSNGLRLIEAVAAGVSKAAAVDALAIERGIDSSQVVAFGDMPNDLPLLAWAGTSYGVANAHPDVLALVDHVIGSQDEDGVAEVLERLFAL